MHLTNVLLVDDDKNFATLVKIRLESADFKVTLALNEEEATKAVADHIFDVSLIDLQLVHQDGISLMERLHTILPEMPVIIITAYGSIESAVEAMKKGAYSYITKPFNPHDVILQIEKALENRKLTSEIKRLKGILEERYEFTNIVARSEKTRQVLERVSRIAKTDSTVYIYGESGTGKELIAKAIHLASGRRDNAFVAINCAALPETLLESELFGHEKGAFTGAVRSKKGLFAQAHLGTLFLDEVADMPLPLQAKLLRVLQDRHFYPVGGERSVEVNIRVVVATQRNLEDLVKQGLFREDLFYRIHVVPIHLPPLRERKEEIPSLVEHFLRKFSQQMKKEVTRLTPRAMQKLMLHEWPGNVRELENTIEYAVAMTQEDTISEDLILETRLPLSQRSFKPLREAKDEFEKEYLIGLLELCEGNVTEAAKLAGKHRVDFYDLLKKHSLNMVDFRKSN